MAIDWYEPSDDGSMVAIGLSEGGTENSVLHVLHVATGEFDELRIGETRAASVAWLPDGTGFWHRTALAVMKRPVGLGTAVLVPARGRFTVPRREVRAPRRPRADPPGDARCRVVSRDDGQLRRAGAAVGYA